MQRHQKLGDRFFYGYIIMIAVFIMQMAMFGPRGSFGVFFIPMENEFGWTRALISGAFSMATIVQGSSGIFMGWLSDRLGPRPVLSVCGLLVGSGFILMSFINAVWQLYLFYVVVVGLGMGGVYAPQISTVAKWFVARKNIFTGIVLTGGGIGGLVVSPVATWLISAYGWRTAYVIIGIAVLIAVIVAAQFLKRAPFELKRVSYDESRSREIEKQDIHQHYRGVSFHEAIHTRQFWMIAAMLFCIGFCFWTVMVHIVPYAADLGISSGVAGNILAIMNGSIILSVVVFGGIADKIGSARSFTICLVLMLDVLFLSFPIRADLVFGLVAIIIAFGAGGTPTLISTLVTEQFGVRSHGVIVGSAAFVYTIGSAVGPFTAGLLFDIQGNYKTAFILCLIMVVVGILLSLFIKPLKERY